MREILVNINKSRRSMDREMISKIHGEDVASAIDDALRRGFLRRFVCGTLGSAPRYKYTTTPAGDLHFASLDANQRS